MDAAALHLRLHEIAPGALLAERAVAQGGEPAGLADAEAHAAAGCSRCARALVNARETGVELAFGGAEVSPPPALRARVLGRVRAAPHPPGRARRFFDPSAEVARLHAGAPGDAERLHEIDDLAAAQPATGDACERFLAQIARSTGFPLLFVSVVRGERVGYRAQRGLAGGELRDRRRETTFCTHTVSGDAPLVVPSAGEEPFFRGSNMVTRFGVKAYVGVPLRTSSGVVIGTVCAMDYRPRPIGAEVVRALELFTEPIRAEIERARRMPAARVARTAAGTPLHRAPWFRALLDLELGLARGAGRPSALVVARGASAELLADLGHDDEAAGRLGPDAVALLLPGADARGAENRCAEIGDALASRGRRLHLVREPAAGHATAASWCEAALGPGA